MINRLFKKVTPDDLLNQLKNKSFNEEKVESMLKTINVNHKNQKLQTFLHLIICEDRIESVRCLLKNNIDYNAIDSQGKTALMLSCEFGYLDAIEE